MYDEFEDGEPEIDEHDSRHKHKCPRCSHLWEHQDSCGGHDEAHRCTNCGLHVFRKFFGEDSAVFESCAALPTKHATREEVSLSRVIELEELFKGKME